MAKSEEPEATLTPRANPDLIGQMVAEEALHNAYESGALAHAWMIMGPEGIGKATLAYRFARYVLKTSGNEEPPGLFGDAPDPGSLFGDDYAPGATPSAGQPGPLYVAPDDPVFRRVLSGGHADISVIERAVKNEKTGERFSVIRVEDVRTIGGFLQMTPAEGGWRVVIIDAADDMNLNAQNALLKVLEEPPARSLILLVCHVPGRLLPTIRSRCRRLSMQPLEPDIVERLIRQHAPDTGADEAHDVAALAHGSIGRALKIIEGNGAELDIKINAIFDNLPKIDVPRLHDFATSLARKGNEHSYDVALELIDRRIRSEIRRAALAGAEGPSLEPWMQVWDNSVRLRERAASVNLDRKQVILGILHEAAGIHESAA